MSITTPLRIGRWNWGNDISVTDVRIHGRQEFELPGDSTGATRRVLFGETFETQVSWNTSINLPSFFQGSWKLQPAVQIANSTSGGPFMIRNQFTGGQFVRQGKRLAFSMSATPTFFGFFPGVGPLSRIRHTVSPQISYQYAPGVQVPEAFARAIDPTGRHNNSRTDPQQTISLGLSQNFEAKLKPPAGDTASEKEPRKIKLLSISTSPIGYNFEQAKLPDHTGWQTPSLTNTFLSDLLPSFQLSISHDLWKGQVGTATAKFPPFLQGISGSFTVTPATLQGLGRLFGLRPHPVAAPTPDTTATQCAGASDDCRRYQGSSRSPYGPRVPGMGSGGGYGGGKGLTLGLSLSGTRGPEETTPPPPPPPRREKTQPKLSVTPTRQRAATLRARDD